MLEVYQSFSDSIINITGLLKHELLNVEIIHQHDTYRPMSRNCSWTWMDTTMTSIHVEVDEETQIRLLFADQFSQVEKHRWENIIYQHWEFVGCIRKANYQLKSRNLLLYTAKTLASPLRLKDVLKQILRNTLKVIEAADAGSIYFFNEKDNLLIPMVTGGYDWKYIKHLRFKPNESLTGLTFSKGKPTIYKNTKSVLAAMTTMEATNRYYFDLVVPKDASGKSAQPRDTMGCPFIIEDKCLGVIVINNFFSEATFNQDDLDLLEAICNQASLAIQRAHLFQEIEGQVQALKKLNESIHHKNKYRKWQMSLQM